MTARVHLTRQLTTLLHVDGPVEVPGTTVAEVIDALEAAVPGTRSRLTDAGRLRRYVLAFVDGEPADLTTHVPEGAEVRFLGAVAGGG